MKKVIHVCVGIIFLFIVFIQEIRATHQAIFLLSTQQIKNSNKLSNFSEKYVLVETMGYGFAIHRSYERRAGITVITTEGMKSLLPISLEDVTTLILLSESLKKRDIQLDLFKKFEQQAKKLVDSEYVLFNKDGPCQVQFRNKEKGACTTVTEAVGVCIIFSHTKGKHMPFLFAQKELFSKQYWESLFTTKT